MKPQGVTVSRAPITTPHEDRNWSAPALPTPKVSRVYEWAFVIASAAVLCLAWYRITREYRNTTSYWEARLSIMADDRVRVIGQLLTSFRNDASILGSLPWLQELLSVRNSDGVYRRQTELARRREEFLRRCVLVYHYSGVYVLDAAGRVLIQAADPREGEALRSKILSTPQLASGENLRVETVLGGQGRELLVFEMPVFSVDDLQATQSSSRRRVGVVILVHDPALDLYPALTAEAVPTRTGESVLWRREGDEVLSLSPLRFPAAGRKRGPLSSKGFSGVAAVVGQQAFGEFTDYRGKRVFGATRRIGMTGWGLVCKIDRDEALARSLKMARLESVVAGLVILVIGVLVVGRRRREEARALRERIERRQDILHVERYAQDVVDSLPAWLLVLSSDLRILSANRPFLDYFRLDLAEIAGRPLREVLRAEPLPHRAAQVTHAGTTTRDVLLEIVIKGRQERRHVRFTMADLVRMGEGERRMLLVIEDLTESEQLRVAAHGLEQRLRESETRFRLLAENAPGVTYLCRNDARYTMQFISAGVEELTGLTRKDFLEDKVSFTELYHPADVEAIRQEVIHAVSERRPFRLAYRVKHHSGAWRWVNEIGVPIYESDELAYWQGTLTEITERKLADAAAYSRPNSRIHS